MPGSGCRVVCPGWDWSSYHQTSHVVPNLIIFTSVPSSNFPVLLADFCHPQSLVIPSWNWAWLIAHNPTCMYMHVFNRSIKHLQEAWWFSLLNPSILVPSWKRASGVKIVYSRQNYITVLLYHGNWDILLIVIDAKWRCPLSIHRELFEVPLRRT